MSLAISVVIPTYQRSAAVRRVLESLARQTLGATDFEVVVSIDGSNDDTREIVSAFTAPYGLEALWQPNGGRASACNAGIRAARGDVVVLLDDDMEASPDFLAAHQRAHVGARRRAVIGAVPVVADTPGPLADYIRAGFERRMARLATSGYAIQFNDVYTGNFSISRATMLEVGGFDERFRYYGHEDYELALRLLRAGVQIVYSGEALAHHHYGKDFAAVAHDSMGRGRNDVLFVAKYPEIRTRLRLHASGGRRPTRLARRMLLMVSAIITATPRWVVALVQRLERRRGARLDACYDFTLDYFYWLGARAARREPGRMA